MNHKRSLIIIGLLAAIGTVSAVYVSPFASWDDLTQKSPDIVIARCTATPDPEIILDGQIWSEVEILSVLKGNTKPAPAKMISEYWPRQGEQFLMFATYETESTDRTYYSATENYRIILLPRNFLLSALTGKPLSEQIQIILRRRLNAVNDELNQAITEKKRLEEGVKQ